MLQKESDVLWSVGEGLAHSTRGPVRTGAPTRQNRTTILSISAIADDHRSLARILDEQRWQIEDANTFRQAIARLCRNRATAIICESSLPDGNWRDLLSYAAELTDPPALVVTSATATEHLREEVHNLGGFGVLSKPFNAEEVNRMLARALQQRKAATG
jgi:DNA-binding NtrC family response regulator